MVEAVVRAASTTIATTAADVVWLLDSVASIQKDLNYLVIIAVTC